MKSQYAPLVSALLLSALSASGAVSENDGQTALVRAANDAFYNLDYEAALADYEKASTADPSSPVYHNYIAQTLLYREMYRDGSLESQLVSGNNSFLRRPRMEPTAGVEGRFSAEIERSMQLSQAAIAKNGKDTEALKALAVAYGLRANYGFLVKKSWKASLSDASQAYKYDLMVTEIDPNDWDARLVPGCYDYVVGSLNWAMRTLGFLAGFHGDKQRGIRTLEEVAEKGRVNRQDAQIILCALYRRENRSSRAIPLDMHLIGMYPRNYLFRFELAQMYAAAGQRQNALDTLNDVARMKREGAPGYDRLPWEKIYYETANLLFWFGDLDGALDNLKKTTADPERMKELDLNTGALAFMREGQIYDMKNEHKPAVEAYRRAIAFAPGAEAARESQRYIGSPYSRHVKN